MKFADYFESLGRASRRAFYCRAQTTYKTFEALRSGDRIPTTKFMSRIVDATELNCSVYDVATYFREIEMRTQRKKLESLMRRKWITPIDALREVGCLRLAARICEMRQEGVNVQSEWVKEGDKHYKKYRIKG